MPSEPEYEAAIEQIQTFAEDFDVEVDSRESAQEGKWADFIEFREQNDTLVLALHPDVRYGLFFYPYDYAGALAKTISEHDQSIQQEVDARREDKERVLAEELLSEHEATKRLTYATKLYADGSRTYVDIRGETRQDFPGYDVYGHVLPYEQWFDIASFCDRFVDVLSAGRRGRNFLHTTTRIEPPDRTESGQFELVVSDWL